MAAHGKARRVGRGRAESNASSGQRRTSCTDESAAQDITELLGGAERVKTRPRGFIEWQPRPQTLILLDQVKAVLDEYAEHLPLTLRQVFYRLVGAHGFDKTEQAYARLGETLNRARRARLIDMAAIRDGGGAQSTAGGFRDADDFLEDVRFDAEHLRLDRSANQRIRLAVLCEAAGMVEQLADVANDYGVSVYSSGGFESVTEKFGFAKRFAYGGRPVEILHIGDHDPSGAHLFLALAEDVTAFADELSGEITFTRLAVTPQQIAELNLPTAPAKPGDRRAFYGETCQVEAIAPDVLSDIVRTAIEDRLDLRAYRRVLAQEKVVRRELMERLR
jgi:hypothetical protein